MKKALIFLLVLGTTHASNAKESDSLFHYFNTVKPELIGGFSSRNTFIGSNRTSVAGVYGGLDYGGKFNLSLGIYWLANKMEKTKTENAFTPIEKEINEVSRFWYWGLTFDYKFYRKNNWTLDVPLRLGIGGSSTRQYELPPSETFLQRTKGVIVPLETGLGALYKPLWWLGFSGGLGTRIVMGNKDAQRFSGTYYTLGVTVFIGDIYKHVVKDMKDHPVKNRKPLYKQNSKWFSRD